MKNLLRSFLIIPALTVGLLAGNAGPAAAASVALATNDGVTYSFMQSVHSPAFSNSKGGYVKIRLGRSCATSEGSFIVRLQQRIGSNWVVQSVTEPVSCSTSLDYLYRDWSYQESGTYRIEFYALSGSGQRRIHYWRVYRSDNP